MSKATSARRQASLAQTSPASQATLPATASRLSQGDPEPQNALPSQHQRDEAGAEGETATLAALNRNLAPLVDALAGLHADLAGLRLEVVALRQELQSLGQELQSLREHRARTPIAASPEAKPSEAAAPEPGHVLTVAAIEERAAALQRQLHQGLSQGLDPDEDAGLDWLIDQMHDLAAEL